MLRACACTVVLAILSAGCMSGQDVGLITLSEEHDVFQGLVLHLQTESTSDTQATHKEMEQMVQQWLRANPGYADGGTLEEGPTLDEHGGYMMRRRVKKN